MFALPSTSFSLVWSHGQKNKKESSSFKKKKTFPLPVLCPSECLPPFSLLKEGLWRCWVYVQSFLGLLGFSLNPFSPSLCLFLNSPASSFFSASAHHLQPQSASDPKQHSRRPTCLSHPNYFPGPSLEGIISPPGPFFKKNFQCISNLYSTAGNIYCYKITSPSFRFRNLTQS